MPLERLQKILSRAGISSRRQAESLILSGKVTVNGTIVRELGAKADPDIDIVGVWGKPVSLGKTFHYYAYYKPRGILVSKRDDWGGSTVFDLLKLPRAVNAVGRLDKESEGLLLLSDDGDFLLKYTHPSFRVSKVYHVLLSREAEPGELRRLKAGVPLEERVVRAVRLRAWKDAEGPWLEMELKEGLKREIRRMLTYVGIRAKRLIRVQHGEIKLERLKPGELRELPERPG